MSFGIRRAGCPDRLPFLAFEKILQLSGLRQVRSSVAPHQRSTRCNGGLARS